MEKKQKTLSLILAMLLGTGTTAQAEMPTARTVWYIRLALQTASPLPG